MEITLQSGMGLLRRVAVACALSLLGLFVGFACVQLPAGVPLGIVALAGIVLLWAIPDLQSIPDQLATKMFYVFIFSVLCVPAYFAVILPGLPWLSFRRLAVFMFAAPTLIVLSGSSRYRHQVKDLISKPSLAYWSLITFLTSIVVCILMSSKLSDSLNAAFNMLLIWVIPFLAVLMFLRTFRQVEFLMKVLVFCTVIDFVIGAVESYLKRPFLIYALPPEMRSQIITTNPLYAILLQGQGVRNGLYRAASTFNISLSWGEMASMLAPLALHFLVHGSKIRDRVFGFIGFIAAFFSVVFSGARGGYVSLLVAVVIFLLIWAFRICRTNPDSLVGPNVLTIATAFSVITLGAVLFVGPVRSYVLGSGNTQSSTDARWAEWALAKPLILASPLWGYGLGTSGEVVGYYPFGSQSATVDSYIITGLIEYGVIGFIAVITLLLCMIVVMCKAYVHGKPYGVVGNAIACSLIAFMVYRITLSQQENMTTMVVLLAASFLIYSLFRDEIAAKEVKVR